MFTEEAVELVRRTMKLIHRVGPQFWVVENPRGMLRTLDLIPGERRTVTLCQYGDSRMKPTDLWGGFPPSLELKPPCKNGEPCHTSAPRGQRSGSQALFNLQHVSAQIPYNLSWDLCVACEADLK